MLYGWGGGSRAAESPAGRVGTGEGRGWETQVENHDEASHELLPPRPGSAGFYLNDQWGKECNMKER